MRAIIIVMKTVEIKESKKQLANTMS